MLRDDSAGHSPQEFMLRMLRTFPGPIAVAHDPFPHAHTLVGGEGEGGRGFAVTVTYVGPAGQRLLVRTKAAPAPIDPRYPPPFVTIDTLHNAFGIYRQGHLPELSPGEPSRTAVSALIDGVAHSGLRVDYPDCCGVEIEWNEQSMQCVGDPATIQELLLRTADEADFAAFVRWPPVLALAEMCTSANRSG